MLALLIKDICLLSYVLMELKKNSLYNEGRGYDETMYPELLCDFKCEEGTEFPFALYEYEFELI